MQLTYDLYHKIATFLDSPQFLRAFFDNRFFLILLVIVLMRMKYATYRSMWLSALVNIPGTFLHELMHFFVGAFMNAQPINFRLLPRRNDFGEYVMGSVSFVNISFYNAIPAALAPLLLLPIGFLINRYLLPEMTPNFINYVLYVLLQTVIIENAIPSRADFHIAAMYPLGIVIYATLAVAALIII